MDQSEMQIMVASSQMILTHQAGMFSYADACRFAKLLRATQRPRVAFIDLAHTTETSTAALAKLIALRRFLLKAGGDLRICGLRGRAEAMYQIYRLSKLLPQAAPPRPPRTSFATGKALLSSKEIQSCRC